MDMGEKSFEFGVFGFWVLGFESGQHLLARIMGHAKLKTQNPKLKTILYLLRSAQFSAWSARKVFYDVKASRNLPWVDLLKKQF